MKGILGRSERWRVRDLIEVLFGGLEWYYREKESADFEVDTLRASSALLGEGDRGLKGYRRREDDEGDGGRLGSAGSVRSVIDRVERVLVRYFALS